MIRPRLIILGGASGVGKTAAAEALGTRLSTSRRMRLRDWLPSATSPHSHSDSVQRSIEDQFVHAVLQTDVTLSDMHYTVFRADRRVYIPGWSQQMMSQLELTVDITAVLIECDVQVADGRVLARGGLHPSNDVPMSPVEAAAERAQWEALCDQHRIKGLQVSSTTMSAVEVAIRVESFVHDSDD